MPVELYGYDLEDENDLIQYGMPRRSGRYPWGSGGHKKSTRDSRKRRS